MRVLAVLSLFWTSAAHAEAPHWDPLPRAHTPMIEGQSASEDDKYATALKHFERAVQRDPWCGMCRLAKAQVLFRLSREAEAVPVMRALASEHPDRYEVWYGLAMALFADEKARQAQPAAEMALQLDPMARSEAALSLYVQVLLRLGETTRAQSTVDDARERSDNPLHDCLEVLIRCETHALDEAEAALSRCEALPDQGTVDAARSRLALTRGNYEQVAEISGRSGDLGQLDAHQAAEAEDFPRAAQLYRALLQEEPKNMSARVGLAIALYNMDYLEDARGEFQRAMGGSDWVHVDRGKLTGVVTSSDEARVEEERAHAAGLYVSVLARLGRAAEARAELDRLEDTLGRVPDLQAAAASVLAVEGRVDEAWARVREVGAANGRSAPLDAAVNLLSERYVPQIDHATLDKIGWPPLLRAALANNSDKLDLCVQIVKESLPDAAPDEVEPLRQRGVFCAATGGDLQSAEALLADLPDEAVVGEKTWFNLALAYLHAGDAQRGLDALDRITEPSDSVAELVRSYRFRALTLLGRLDEAVAMLDTGGISATDRLMLSVALADASKFEHAAEVVEGHCASIEGPNQQICTSNLEIYRENAELAAE